MKIKRILTTVIIGASFSGTAFFTACTDTNKTGSALVSIEAVDLENEEDSISYAYGVMLASNVKRAPNTEVIKDDIFFKAFIDTYSEKTVLLNDRVAAGMIRNYNKKKDNERLEKNLLEGKAFLDANKTKEGVITLKSGLQYKILKEGNGPKPKATDKVKTHYHGTLIDGTVFDSSVERGQPLSFNVGGVIKGWTEALQLMPVGSKWKLFIPSNLAYGARGAGQKIGPHAALIFEVELLEIEAPTNK